MFLLICVWLKGVVFLSVSDYELMISRTKRQIACLEEKLLFYKRKVVEERERNNVLSRNYRLREKK